MVQCYRRYIRACGSNQFLLISSRAVRQIKVVATGRIGRQNAFQHAALHVEEIVQLLARIFFPRLEDLFFEFV